MIFRDTPFWRCQADRQSFLLGSDLEWKGYYQSVLGEVEMGDNEAGQSG